MRYRKLNVIICKRNRNLIGIFICGRYVKKIVGQKTYDWPGAIFKIFN